LVGGVNEPALVELRAAPAPPEPDLAVVAVHPADGTTGVPSSTAIDVTFNRSINVATLIVNTSGTACTGQSLQVSRDDFATCVPMSGPAVEVAANTYRVEPVASLLSATTYKVRVTTALHDADGEALATTFTSSGFTTEAPSLVSLTVTPNPLEHTLGPLWASPQFTAIATFSDTSSADVTGI
jgi:hypothetical protein